MVYVYKKTVGNKSYYYLRVSQRKGAKVLVKDIAYLGTTPEEVQKALGKLPQYATEIRKAYKTLRNFLQSSFYLDTAKTAKLKHDEFLQEKIFAVEACRLHFQTDFEKKASLSQREIWKNVVIEFAYNTTSIEGNTVTLREARKLLQDGLSPKDKTLREINDLQNTENVFLQLLQSKEELSHEFIQKMHQDLMNNIDPRKGYRIEDVHVLRAHFEATPAPYVKTDMSLLLKWYQNHKRLHPLVLATLFHHKFEKIHPFMDGNGRTGRMLLNYILLQHRYPPAIIRKKERADYLKVLSQADKVPLTRTEIEKYRPIIAFVASELQESYWNLFL